MSDFAGDFFWEEVSGTHDATQHAASLVRGKVAVAQWWPHLASSADERDFSNRLEMLSGRIEAVVDPEVYPEVVSSLYDDYRAVHEASKLPDAPIENPKASVEESQKEILDSAQENKKESAYWHDQNPSNYAIERSFGIDSEHYEPGRSVYPKTEAGELGFSHKINDQDYDNPYGEGSQEHSDYHAGFHPKREAKQATNYQPDPNRAWRYYAPYEQLQEPVNNGALQDADGFVVDLAQGEDRANEVMEQRQLTPGQWHDTPGTAMPERPMPFSQQRGYQPVAASNYKPNGEKCGECGAPTEALVRDGAVHKRTFHEPQCPMMQRTFGQPKKSAFDPDGFLVQASDVAQEGVGGRANSPLVDPAPGTPLKVNPYYFNTGEAAMGANEGFPAAPSPDPYDRVNEIYGEQQPAPSAQDTSSTLDGKGYSKSQPGKTLQTSSSWEKPELGEMTLSPDGHWGHYESINGHPNGPRMFVPHREAGPTPDQAMNYHLREHVVPGESPNFSATATAVEDAIDLVNGLHGHKGLTPQPWHQKWDARDKNRKDWQRVPKVDPYGTGFLPADEPEVDYRKRPIENRQAVVGDTDGKIVKKCPGCGDALRRHKTPHGEELHHLKNDHVRCHGAKKSESAIPNGGNWGGHDAPLSFKDALALTTDYGTTLDSDELQFLASLWESDVSNGRVVVADYLGRPDANNPTGRGPDEYRARTWDAFQSTHPMQSVEDRNINTPVLPQTPMKTGPNINTPTPGLSDSERDDDDDDEGDD